MVFDEVDVKIPPDAAILSPFERVYDTIRDSDCCAACAMDGSPWVKLAGRHVKRPVSGSSMQTVRAISSTASVLKQPNKEWKNSDAWREVGRGAKERQ